MVHLVYYKSTSPFIITFVCPDRTIVLSASFHIVLMSPPRTLTCFASNSASGFANLLAQYGVSKQWAEPQT